MWNKKYEKNSFYEWIWRAYHRCIMFLAKFPDAGQRAARLACVVWQVALLSAIWIAMERLRMHFGWTMPAGLLGCALLAAGLFAGWLKVEWFDHGTRWLLADMLLFFVPAMLVVTEYPDLVRSQGLRILAVIVLSTACVLAATAFAVDRVYRLELWWSRRQSTRHARLAARRTLAG